MSLIPITIIGDKVLSKKTKPVQEVDEKLKKLIESMFETMYNAHGMGLAANQVGVDKSLFIADLSSVEGYESYKPMVFINPQIISASDEKITMEEGCLSIPDIRAEVDRPKAIKLQFHDLHLKQHEIEDDDLIARVAQHEIDHLNGIYFTDRVSDDMKRRLKKKINLIRQRKIKIDYPITPKENNL